MRVHNLFGHIYSEIHEILMVQACYPRPPACPTNVQPLLCVCARALLRTCALASLFVFHVCTRMVSSLDVPLCLNCRVFPCMNASAREPLSFISTHTHQLAVSIDHTHTIDMIITCEVLPCAFQWIKLVLWLTVVAFSRSDMQRNLKDLTCEPQWDPSVYSAGIGSQLKF